MHILLSRGQRHVADPKIAGNLRHAEPEETQDITQSSAPFWSGLAGHTAAVQCMQQCTRSGGSVSKSTGVMREGFKGPSSGQASGFRIWTGTGVACPLMSTFLFAGAWPC